MIEPIEADCLAEIRGVRHGFFTRAGGASEGLYGSLNCGLGSKDARDRVTENRSRVAAHLAGREAPVLTCFQVHSADALVVEGPWGDGSAPKADALVTRTPGLVLGALAADCAPVLFCDPEARVIGAAHAGWKGALDGILEATIATMQRLGARPARIRAVLGPCIGRDAYEVGPEFETRFIERDPANQLFFRRRDGAGKPRFDLPGYVLSRLARAGLDTVESCHVCTYSDPDRFFSYRRTTHNREPDYGRQISAIILV